MEIDLSTRIGRLKLQSPVIVGSCPLTTDELQRISMINNGVGAIVLPSCHPSSDKSKAEYCDQLVEISNQCSVPVIASIRTGLSDEAWRDLPSKLADAGAAAIEISLDVYRAEITDSQSFKTDLFAMAQRTASATDVPLLLKLTPNVTGISSLAKSLHDHIQGLVMFGRSPVIDIELDSLVLTKRWSFTPTGAVVTTLQPLMRTKSMFPPMPLIACGGIGTSEDLIKSILAGADAVMVTSAIYRNGVAVLGSIRDGLIKYMSHRGVRDLSELRALCPPVSQTTWSDSKLAEEASLRTSEISSDRFGHPIG